MNETELAKIGLEEIKTYKCKLCNKLLPRDLDSARAHAALPIKGLDLPVGFTYRGINPKDNVSWISVIVSRIVNNDHGINYEDVSSYEKSGDRFDEVFGLSGSLMMLNRFGPNPSEGVSYSRLKEPEFLEFMDSHPIFLAQLEAQLGISRLYRTCPDIETLLMPIVKEAN